MKKFYLFMLLIGLWSTTFGQMTFEKIIDSSDNYGEEMKASCINDAGEIVILASKEMQISVVKVSAVGDTLWHNTYPVINSSVYGESICEGSDGGYLIGGHYNDMDGQDIYLLKIDEQGNKLWNKQIGVANHADYCYDLKQVAGEGYFLSGRTYVDESEKPLLLKLNQNGEEVWQRTDIQIDGVTYANHINPRSLEVISDGILLAGDCYVSEDNQTFITKVDFDGNQIWNLQMGNVNSEYLKNISLCTNGDIAFVGYRTYQTYNNSYNKVWYGKVNNLGVLLWEKELRESNTNFGHDIVEDSEDNLIIAGLVYSQDYSDDPYLAKVDNEGNLLWEKVFGGNQYGGLKACYLSGDNIYGVGNEHADWNWGKNYSSNSLFLVKTDLNGNVNDLEIFNSSNSNCEGQDTGLRTLSFLTNYAWETPNTGTDYTENSCSVSKAGNYSVSATDRNGNVRQSNILTIYPKPIPNISFSGETTICKGETITLSTSQEYSSYEWFRTDTIDAIPQLTSVGTSREYVANQTAIYQVQVTNENGCQNRITTWEGYGEKVTVIDPKVDILSVNKRAISAIIGDGKELNEEASTSLPAPWGTYRKSSHQQYLIRADELQAMGLEANSVLKEMAFFLEKANNSGTSIAEFRIRIASTSKKELNGLDNTESYKDVNNNWVYENDAIGAPSIGWKNFNISYYDYNANQQNGYLWDGRSNLIIDVSYYNNQEASFSKKHSIFRMTEMGYKASWVRFATTNIKYEYSGGISSTLRPNIRFKAELPSGEDLIVGCGKEVRLKLDKEYAEVLWSTGSTDDQILVADESAITVTTTDDYGCVATDTKEIKLSTFDIEILADKTTYCEGDQANLSIQGDYPFLQWNTGETTSSILTNESGKYSIEVRNEDQCVANDTVEILEIKKPNIFENINNTDIIPGQEINGYNYIGQFEGHQYYLSNTDYGYHWTDARRIAQDLGGHLITISSKEENDFIQNSETGNVIFCLGMTDYKNEGEWKWENGEEVNYTNWGEGNPQADLSGTQIDYSSFSNGKWFSSEQYASLAILIEFDFDIPRQTICDSTILVASGDFTSYTWNKNGVAIGTDAFLTIKEPGTYTVTGISKIGCSLTSDPIEISKVSTSPVVDGIVSGSLCTGDSQVSFDAGEGFTSYLWNTGETTQSINTTDEEIYSVIVTNVDGCTSEKSFLSKCKIYVATDGNNDNTGTIASPFLTIQYAIDNSSAGDTIIVKEGTYFENIQFKEKQVVLASEFVLDNEYSHIEKTIIDGNEDGTVVTFSSTMTFESYGASLIGFTIQNGRVDLNSYETAAGVDIHNASPTISDLIIKNNRSRNGGGMYVYYAEPKISNIVFESNIASDNGDDLFIQGAYANTKVDHLYFSGKKYSQSKVFIQQDQEVSVAFNNWTFENIDSGALQCNGSWNTSTKVELNNFRLKNTKSGFNLNQGHFVFNNFFAEGVESDVLTIGNSAYVALINSTLVRNNLAVRMTWGDSKLLVLNSILRNNLNEEIVYDTNESNGKSIEIAYSNIKGGKLAIQGNENNLFHYNFADNNIDKKEFFKDVDNKDFHLLDFSPSIAAGVAEYTVFDHTYKVFDTDFDGKKRSIPTGSSVDLGAFENESISRKIVRAISCNGGNDGSIEIEMLTGSQPFTYIWDDENATQESKILVTEADKMYHVTITDGEGKIYRDSAWITQPDELIAFVVDSTNISRQGLADGEINIGVSGGNEPYSYYWEGIEKTTSYVNNLEADKFYNVTVIDEKGCQAHKSVVLKVLPVIENNLCGFASEDGEIKLNSTDINAIETDFEGTIWFATGQELTSYNGKDWDVINANFSYRSIHKDKDGNIWLGAEWGDKGLNMFDGRSWFPYKETDGLSGNNVYGITEDTYGNLWIATDKGVSRFNGKEFTNFDKNDGLLENHAMTIFADQDGYIWVGSNSGVSRYKTLSKDQGEEWENFQYEDEVSLGGINNFIQDKNGNIWMSLAWANEGQSGLIKFDGTNWSRVDMNLDITLTSITDIYCDVEGHIWVGSSEGLAHFDGATWHYYQKDIELPSNYVSAIGEDAYGAIWVGYSNGDNGISKYFNGQWTTLYKSNGSNNNSIQAMAVDENQNLWVGTSDWNNSLKKFDGNTWKIFNYEDGYEGYVYDLDTDSELKVWVGTNQGLYKYNGTTFDKYDTANGLQNNNIHGIAIDANDNVWISYEGAYEGSGGLDRFSDNKITHFSKEDGLQEDNIRDVQADSKGNIWISYSGEQSSKLSKYDGVSFTTVSPNDDESTENYSLEKMFVDSKDRVWVSGQYRLAVYDGTSWNYHELTKHGVTTDNYINGIGEDADGNIWISFYNNWDPEFNNSGMVRYNGTDWILFSKEDGLSNGNISCIQDDYKGHIWFGSDKGLIRYTKCTNEEVIVTVNNGGCSGEGNRKLILTPTGENAPYEYSIDNGAAFQSENIFNGLIAGSYHLLVKNKNGELIADRELMITEPVPLRANVEGFNVTCNGRTDGAAVCLPTGGTAPYTFIWDDANATTTARVEGLSEDVEYTVTITDANDCTATGIISVGHDPHLKFTDWKNVSCNGLNDGMAVITPIGGKMPFTFKWDDINQTTDSIVTSLSGDKYHFVTVTDANDCVAIDSIKLEQPKPFIANAVHFNSCDGKNTGGIELNISGGTVPYTYQWDDDDNSTEGNIYKLGAGTYSVIVKDASGCEAETAATIVQHDDSQSVEIVGSKDEYFCPDATELVATDGFTSYKWSTGETETTIVPESPGKYFVRVFNENGCSVTDTIKINSLRTYQDQQLCLVTVNQDNKNEIVWERRGGMGIVSYNIYKESNSASSFELVKNIPIDEKSALVDEDSDPSSRSHIYAISIVDVCGVESRKSDVHHTMLLQANRGINGEVNLDWNKYEGFEFETYNIYRGSSVEDMNLLTSISNSESKYIDNNPPREEQFYYVLEVENDYTCNPSRLKSSLVDYSISRSNYLAAQSTITGIVDVESNIKDLKIYPNPMKEKSRIEFDNPNFNSYNLSVYDASGRLIIRRKNITSDRYELLRGELSPGQYIVEIRGDNIYRGRLIIE